MVTSGILPSRDTRTSLYIVGTVAPAHPCAPRHSDILSIVAGGREKVRPGTGREAGLGHAGSDLSKLPVGLIVGRARDIVDRVRYDRRMC